MTTRATDSSAEDEIPLPSQQPLEIDFMEHGMNEYRDTNGKLPAKYDANKRRFVQRPRKVTFRSAGAATSFDLSPDESQANELSLVATTESFNEAIEKLQAKNKNDDKIAKFSLSDCHDWNEVSKVLKNAEKTYENGDSVSGKIRRAFRRVGNHSKSIQSFVGLLPDGNYKTLCGGLTLVLTAMGRHTEVREMIAELLEELPDFAKDCEDYLKIYPGQNMLKVRVNELYAELIGALEEIVKWYTHSLMKRVTSSLLRNSSYGEDIEKRIQNIHKCRTRFHTEADKFEHYMLQAMDETGLDTNVVARRIDKGMNGVQESLNDLTVEAKRRDSMVSKAMGDATSAMNGTKEILADAIENARWNGQRDELMKRMLEDRERNEQDRKRNEQNRKAIEQERKEMEYRLQRKDSELAKTGELVNQLAQTPRSLIERLEIGSSASALDSDLAVVQSAGLNESTSTSFQSRSRYVTETPEFQKWLGRPKSAVLIVEGNEELESISSLSFLVALLYEKLERKPKVLALPIFCGMLDNSTSDDSESISWPTIMLRRLLAQLLERKEIDWEHGDRGRPCLSFIGQSTLAELEAGSYTSHLTTMMRLISILIRMYDCIFIMIDGVDFVDEEAYDETKQLIDGLIQLVRATFLREKGEVAGSIKVLWTASTHLEYRARSGKGVAVLDMPEENDDDDEEDFELSDELSDE